MEHENHGQKAIREEYPTGWLALVQKQSVGFIVDALLDLPPHREFNQKELAEFAGVSRKSVNRHLGLLKQTNLIEEVPKSSPQRYRFNPESEVSKAVMQLDAAMNKVGPHAEDELEA